MSSSLSPAWLGRPRRAAAWLLSVWAENAEGALHATVMIGVLLAAEDARREGYPEEIGAAALVVVLFWLMSFYGHTLGVRLKSNEPLKAALLWRTFVHEFSIIEGAIVPLLVLLIAWAAGATVSSGGTAALWTAVGVIVTLEVVAGRRAGLHARGFWLQAGAGAAIGLAIAALHVVLH